MSKSKLKHQIKKKLDQLSELLNKTDEARIIETGEPNT
jgi:outer membrane protein OmpA-like peptidoglycan-associated protein